MGKDTIQWSIAAIMVDQDGLSLINEFSANAFPETIELRLLRGEHSTGVIATS